MRDKAITNLAASVRARLGHLARARGEDVQAILSLYARERWLYRLSQSEYRERLVLKGAFLFVGWLGQPHRPTRDLDLLSRGEPDLAAWEEIFRALCYLEVEPDGVQFMADSVVGERIKAEQEYPGVRLRLTALLERARIVLQVDIGFGDAIVPAPEEVEIPALLDFPAARLQGYPREAVVAEKFHALVALGMGNTRLKDFYDLWHLSRSFAFNGQRVSQALAATFARRKTALPEIPPLALTDEFARDEYKAKQWQSFLSKGNLTDAPADLAVVTESLIPFLLPPAQAAAQGAGFPAEWRDGAWHTADAKS